MIIIRTLSVYFIITIHLLSAADNIYQEIRVFHADPSTLQSLNNLGIPLDHVRKNKDESLDVVVTMEEAHVLLEIGIPFDVRQHDLTEYFVTRSMPGIERDFPLGSMLGNYTLLEAIAQMDTLRNMYPDFISEKDSIGTSIEGRTIWAFKVSDYPSVDEDEPEVLYTGLTHAREPVSMMNLFFFVRWLCENYSSDPTAEFLVNHREMWFVPIINPDGYVYNETIAPNGGGMHRKNRRPNPDNSNCNNGTQQGIDLNRNYSYNWGADNSGSSGNPCSAVYRGASAFSEPETEAISNFILARQFKNVLHYHTYSNVLIHSWGDGTFPDEPDLSTLREIGAEMTRENGYAVGTGTETIGYGVNGDAVDWTYGTAGLISYTPEVGSYADNFWPSEDRVVPLCQDQVHSNKIFALVAGSDYIVYDRLFDNQFPTLEDTVAISLVIQNRGLADSDGSVSLTINPLNDVSLINSQTVIIQTIPSRTTDTTIIFLSVPAGSINGTKAGLVITIQDTSSLAKLDSVSVIFGTPEVIFQDGGENGMTFWTDDDEWGTVQDAAEGMYSITDSPIGDYVGDWGTSITQFINPLSFAGVVYPYVTFESKWSIEKNYDFVQFQISTDGISWHPLSGNYTTIGSGQTAQPSSEPGYDGYQEDWVNEFIDLAIFAHEPEVNIRFILSSDGSVEEDGFYFDDFSINGYQRFLKGDLYQDQILNVYDLLVLIEYTIFNNTIPANLIPIGDMNADGFVNADDIGSLIALIMGY
jgi:hypothetical protein